MVVPFALVFAAHPAPYAPHHPAPYHEPYQPAPHGYCDPKAPPACALDSDLPYCVVDVEYPDYEVANKISQDPIFLKKYSDVADQSADDLVEAITAFQEASFNYDYYTGASKVSFYCLFTLRLKYILDSLNRLIGSQGTALEEAVNAIQDKFFDVTTFT